MSPLPNFVRGGKESPPDAYSPAPPAGRRGVPRRRAGGRPAARAAGSRRTPQTVPARVRVALGSAGKRVDAARWRVVDAVAPRLSAARRVVGPYASMVTALGWVVLGGAVVLGLVGLNRGWLEFRTLAVMLVLLLLAAVAFTLGRWEYSAVIELGNRRVRIGDLALGRVEVRNASSRAAASSTIELPVGRNVAPFRVPRLAGGEAHEEVFQVPARRRGVVTIGPVRSVRSDPVGLIQRERSWTDPVELFVHPDTVLLDTRAIGFLKDVEGVATQNLSSSDVSFHALREYVPGDDRRSIHWRTTARVGKLMVRQFEETMRSHLLLILTLNPDHYATGDDFELAVSAIGSIGQAAIREQRTLSVFTSDGILEFPSAVGLLDQLCRVELRPRSMPLRELAAEAALRVPGASVVALTVGSKVPPADLRGAQLALPPDATTFALRCGRELTAARRKAASLLVLDVGSLQDLQRGLRTLS